MRGGHRQYEGGIASPVAVVEQDFVTLYRTRTKPQAHVPHRSLWTTACPAMSACRLTGIRHTILLLLFLLLLPACGIMRAATAAAQPQRHYHAGHRGTGEEDRRVLQTVRPGLPLRYTATSTLGGLEAFLLFMRFSELYASPHVGCAVLTARAYWMLIGACNLMLCPIHGVQASQWDRWRRSTGYAGSSASRPSAGTLTSTSFSRFPSLASPKDQRCFHRAIPM